MRDDIESQILDIIENKKSIHYSELVNDLNVGLETARRFCVEIAQKYPLNLKYRSGILTLIKSLTFDDLPDKKRVEALKKTLDTKENLLKMKEEIEKKLKENHLPHALRALETKKLDELKRILVDSMKLLGENNG